MNKQRRKSLYLIAKRLDAIKLIVLDNKCIGNCEKEIDKIVDDIYYCLYEEEFYMDNMPENLQYSRKYSDAEDACDSLNSAIENINSIYKSNDTKNNVDFIEKAIENIMDATM